MKTVHCHPDNAKMLQQQLRQRVPINGINHEDYWGLRIKASKHVEKDRPTGRYIMPDGKVIERDQINLRHKFVTYGPEDAELLVYMKYIREEREAYFYISDDTFIRRMWMDFGPVLHTPIIHGSA